MRLSVAKVVLLAAVLPLSSCTGSGGGPFRLVSPPLRSHEDRTLLEATLEPTLVRPFASGTARFEVREDRIRFSTQVEDLCPKEGFDVLVNNSLLGSIRTDSLGSGDLNLDDRDGDTVPQLEEGDRVDVFNDRNELVLSGVLVERLILATDLVVAGTESQTSGSPESGEAEFRKRADRMRFEVRVDHVFCGCELDVHINGSPAGSIVVNGSGDGELKLDTDTGNSVPNLAHGDGVEILDPDGEIILSGVLQRIE